MKVIFLDIDGVLNSELFYRDKHNTTKKPKRASTKSREDYQLDNLDPNCISYLNDLIDKTGAKIVISSTWRMGNELDYLTDLLAKRGFKGEVIDYTPILSHKGMVRGNEIHSWIEDNCEKLCGSRLSADFREYVIFDDDSDMLYWQRNNFIHVDRWCGLTPNHCYKAQFILCPELKYTDMYNYKSNQP